MENPELINLEQQNNITLRDLFAGMVMMGWTIQGETRTECIAMWAYEQADEMLKVRNNELQTPPKVNSFLGEEE